MPDIADKANAFVEETDRLAVLEVQRRPEQEVAATGFCLDCDEELADGRRWCDAECRDLWQRTQRPQRGRKR